MKKLVETIGWISCIVLLVSAIIFLYKNDKTGNDPKPLVTRDTVEMQLTAESKESFSVPATKVPEFAFDISDAKFQEIAKSSKDDVKNLVSASITYQGKTREDKNVEAEIDLNAEKHKLIVHPKDLPNFRPGMYKLHLTLRTLEGPVNIDQDFTWGVIAVNTNKSIYKPGDVALIGMGVLNDKGETQCVTGENTAKVWLTVTSPNGVVKDYSTDAGTVKDSGKCGPITVTNTADFASMYLISEPGIYTMKVTAEVNGAKRTIEDYFKVAEDVAFDIERTSFPTRIYPKASYKVTFTITPKEDYNGSVEEFMPSDFTTEKISGDGKEETVGEFKKITWNVGLKKGQPQEFTYLIRFPPVSPEFYLLGPITVGDFKEARQWQVASDAINSTSGLVAYEDNNGSNTFSRVWTGTAWNPNPPTGGTNIDPLAGGGDDAPDDSRWFVTKSNPKTGEKLVAAFDNCTAPINDVCIWMYRWTGSAWAEEDFVLDVDSASVVTTDTRIMDIAYEEQSGEALFVFSDNTTQLKYRIRSGGSWSATQNAGTALDSRKMWVKAKADFNSDTILVGYLNDNQRIGALIWDGSTNTFGNQFEDDDSPAQTETSTDADEAFDIAWETQSATPMIFWGTAAQQLMYREFSSGTWSGETVIYTTDTDAANDIGWVTAASDPRPTSNYIAIAMHERFDTDTTDEVVDCEFGMWNGTSAETLPSNQVCRSDADNRLNTVAFTNNTGEAMFAFVTSAAGTQMSTRMWTAGSASPGSVTTQTGAATSGIESIQLHSDLNSTSMIALYAADSNDADTDPDVYSRSWDGTSWDAPVSLYGRIQGAGENAEAYGFGFDRNVETMAAYRWFANNNGTSVSTALTGQDNPYTLTTPNEQFRLRLLLYYPDSLAINGRDYKLQFIDPGNGTCGSPSGTGTPSTWTDVGTPSSGTEISYYNNATPADGDNLTSNGNDPTYSPYTKINQDYEEGTAVTNPLYFTNSVSAMSQDQVGLWDFSLVDNTTYDVTPQTFCFRVIRSNGIVLQIDKYPQISTATVVDVLIQSGTFIDSGTLLQ